MNSATFSALAEPNRLRIVELLRKEPLSVNQIAEKLTMRQPQVSKHLSVLSQAGLVTVQPIAQQRVYALSSQPFIQLEDWAESFRKHWEQKFDSLEVYLAKGK